MGHCRTGKVSINCKSVRIFNLLRHYKKAKGAILVYDITNRNSFLNIKKWLKELQSNSEEACEIVLIGNKLDIAKKEKRAVSYQEAKEFADENNLIFRETSAILNYNVNDLFLDLIEMITNGDYTPDIKSATPSQNGITLATDETKVSCYQCCTGKSK